MDKHPSLFTRKHQAENTGLAGLLTPPALKAFPSAIWQTVAKVIRATIEFTAAGTVPELPVKIRTHRSSLLGFALKTKQPNRSKCKNYFFSQNYFFPHTS